MVWWQGILIVLACVIVGVVVSYLLSYPVVRRILKKPFRKLFSEKRKIIKQQLQEQLKREVEEAGKIRGAEEPERKEAVAVEEPLESIVPDLVAEVKNNHRIATEPWSDKLIPFQTRVWDTRQDEVYELPRNLREDLTQAYVDMRLANSIVWLSAELGRRSHNLDENYIKLCSNIAARLDRITSQVP